VQQPNEVRCGKVDYQIADTSEDALISKNMKQRKPRKNDGWSDPYGKRTYLGIVARYIDKATKMIKHCILAIKQLPHPHTHQHINIQNKPFFA
jgi:hypothetical protein